MLQYLNQCSRGRGAWLLMALTAFILELVALWFQHVMLLQPCVMCIYERCALFGISNDVAMQVVGIGFIIGVIQDSCETGLNSSSDVVFTATAEYRQLIKEGKEVHLGKDSFAYHELS